VRLVVQTRVLDHPRAHAGVRAQHLVLEPGAEPPVCGDAAGRRRSVLAFDRRHRLRDGEQTILVQTAAKPVYAGVGPYNKRIDRDSDDNVLQEGGRGRTAGAPTFTPLRRRAPT
jgi:hypothetical protein